MSSNIKDNFKSEEMELHSPAEDAQIVTPNDDGDLPYIPRAFLVASDGNVKVTTKRGTVITFTGLKQGMLIPLRVTRIWSTGTTVSGIVILE